MRSAPALRIAPALRWTLIWTAVSLIFSLQTVSRTMMRGQPIDWFQAFAIEALYWLPWLCVTPFLTNAARRWPFVTPRWRPIAKHLALMLAVSVVQVSVALSLQIAAIAMVRPPRAGMAETMNALFASAPGLLIMACWKYWVVIGIIAAFSSSRQLRERELRAAHLETQLSTAHLRALKAQLHPHFLFNALHSAAMLTFLDADAATTLIADLSALLRTAIERDGALMVTLEEEIDFVARYVAIEQIRFQDRLQVAFEVGRDVTRVALPTLLLQPLVENAIHHGFARRASTGHLVVRAYRETLDDSLIVEVEDDGPGLPPQWSMQSTGVGLSNITQRLELTYGDEASLALLPASPTGVLARIRVPCRGAGARSRSDDMAFANAGEAS